MSRISKLEERLDSLERQLKALTLDSDDLFDRFKRLSGRVAKRDEREQNAELEPASGGEGATVPGTPLSPTWSKLSARQKQLQLEILRRRGNGGI